jgi:hypothetical protein
MNADHAPVDRSRAAAPHLTRTTEGEAAAPRHGNEVANFHPEPAKSEHRDVWDQWKSNRDLY